MQVEAPSTLLKGLEVPEEKRTGSAPADPGAARPAPPGFSLQLLPAGILRVIYRPLGPGLTLDPANLPMIQLRSINRVMVTPSIVPRTTWTKSSSFDAKVEQPPGGAERIEIRGVAAFRVCNRATGKCEMKRSELELSREP